VEKEMQPECEQSRVSRFSAEKEAQLEWEHSHVLNRNVC
jgi:hypothetical protein